MSAPDDRAGPPNAAQLPELLERAIAERDQLAAIPRTARTAAQTHALWLAGCRVSELEAAAAGSGPRHAGQPVPAGDPEGAGAAAAVSAAQSWADGGAGDPPACPRCGAPVETTAVSGGGAGRPVVQYGKTCAVCRVALERRDTAEAALRKVAEEVRRTRGHGANGPTARRAKRGDTDEAGAGADLVAGPDRASPTWGIGDVVLIANQYGRPNAAEVSAENPARPNVVKVVYQHSRTAAWVARSRVLGQAPARTDTDQVDSHVGAVQEDPDVDTFAVVTEPAAAARTAAATPSVPSPAAGAPAELVRVPPAELVSVQARERVERYQAAATSANTVRAYRHDWSEWTSWCAEHTYTPLPASPAVIAAYAAELADRLGISVATIERRLAAIGRMHREAVIDPPPTRALEVQRVMTGIRRTLGTAPRNQRAALSVDELRRLLFSVDSATLAGDRDRALLLVGYYFAGRRSELVALDVEDLVEVAEGLRVDVRRSKTDQEGAGEVKGIPRKPNPEVCPVVALLSWLENAGIAEGPIWRRVTRWDTVGSDRLTAQSVNLIVKRACLRAGIDPTHYAGHSLRSGFSTAAGLAQAPERAIMRQTGHRSERMLRKYIRPASVFVENAGAWVNL